MALTDIIIRNAKKKDKSYKLTDSKGLHLLIHQNGSKYWRFRYRFLRKENMLSLGAYPEITLKEARNRRDCTRKKILEGIDPAQEKKLKKLTMEFLIHTRAGYNTDTGSWYLGGTNCLTSDSAPSAYMLSDTIRSCRQHYYLGQK